MDWIKKRLREQTTHSAVVLAIIMLFAAHAAGVDLVDLTKGAGDLLVALAAASAAAKVLLPEQANPLSDGAKSRLERLAVQDGDAVAPEPPVANVAPVPPAPPA